MDNDGKVEVLGLSANVTPGNKVVIEIGIRLREDAKVRTGMANVQVLSGEARQNSEDVYEAFLPIVKNGTILGSFETQPPN